MSRVRVAELWVVAILLATYSYYWQSRDWNSASRLMLTYAVVDRGTVSINGLEDQTHDRAYVRGHFYTDKLPGFSLLAAAPYAIARMILRLPSHPLGARGFTHWPADYWVALGVSGLATALSGGLLVGLARDLGCGPRRSALVGLAYGLGTPAYAYATMSYGHQASAFALLGSFALLWRTEKSRPVLRVFLAGFLASYAAVIELQVGPVAGVLGGYLFAQVVAGDRKASALGDFAVGAALPVLILLGYNQLAFGSPWDMGYFHHTTKIFADVHSNDNPLGLRRPAAARAFELLWGRYRGLCYYAPITLLVPPGLAALALRRFYGPAVVSALAMTAVFAVNLCYPEWTGGWSTGPRLLVPLLPFAMLPVAGLIGRSGKWATSAAALLAITGGVLMVMFVGIGGRVPQYYEDPLAQVVWPLWRGRTVAGWTGEPFARNLVSILAPKWTVGLGPAARWLQFSPLLLAQAVAIPLMLYSLRPVGGAGKAPEPL